MRGHQGSLFEDMLRETVRSEMEGLFRKFGIADGVPVSSRPVPTETLITIPEAAELVSVCKGTIRNWLKEGKLTRYGNGRRLVRINRDELLRLMASAAPRCPKRSELTPEARAAKILAK